MKRCSLWIIILLVGLFGTVGSAAAGGSKVAAYMGDLRWGMTESEVIRYLEAGLQDKYKPLIKKASGRRETELREEVRRLQREIRESHTEFEGGSRWDRSVIGGEFNHDNRESMLVFKGDGYESHYLFYEGKLWKWVKAVDSGKFGGRDLGKVGKKLAKRFGKGFTKSGERNPTAGKQKWIEWRDRTSRLRAVDVTGQHGQFALVFVELSTDGELASVRRQQKSSGSRMASSSSTYRSPAPTKARSEKKRKSIFGGGGEQESEREYQERAKRERADALAKQRKMHERKDDAKKGKVLDAIGGLDDEDPMSGL